jgi:uncharacterized protein
MLTPQDIRAKRDAIMAIARRHGASHLRVFGSMARGQTRETSDLDLIVRFEPGRSLMDHGMLIEELQAFLGIHVDVVSEGALHDRDRFSCEALKEAVSL